LLKNLSEFETFYDEQYAMRAEKLMAVMEKKGKPSSRACTQSTSDRVLFATFFLRECQPREVKVFYHSSNREQSSSSHARTTLTISEAY